MNLFTNLNKIPTTVFHLLLIYLNKKNSDALGNMKFSIRNISVLCFWSYGPINYSKFKFFSAKKMFFFAVNAQNSNDSFSLKCYICIKFKFLRVRLCFFICLQIILRLWRGVCRGSLLMNVMYDS